MRVLSLVTLLVVASAQVGSVMWTITSGSDYCHVSQNGSCVTDGQGPHGNSEACTIVSAVDLYATATTFDTESYFDFIMIASTRYSGNGGPVNHFMAAGATMSWSSDSSVTRGGWTICGSASLVSVPPLAPPPPPPNPSPPPPAPAPPQPPVTPSSGATAYWEVVDGSAHCQVIDYGACVTDGLGPHGNSESCIIRASRALYATATYFNTESYFDHITIGATRFSGPNQAYGPFNVIMHAGETMAWTADSQVAFGGFTICASNAAAVLPPPSPTPQPPPPAPRAPVGTMWTIRSGYSHCHTTNQGQCVTDGAGNHGNDEQCTVRANQQVYVAATYFATESFFDYIIIGTTRYSGSQGPYGVQMSPGQTFAWHADSSVTSGGWIICGYTSFSVPPQQPLPPFQPMPAMPPPAPQPMTDYFVVDYGSAHCGVVSSGTCVQHVVDVDHGSSVQCTIRTTQVLYVTATYFNTQTAEDTLTIDELSLGPTNYSGVQGPSNVLVAAGSTMIWSANASHQRTAFVVCGSAIPFPAMPPPGSPPLAPSPSPWPKPPPSLPPSTPPSTPPAPPVVPVSISPQAPLMMGIAVSAQTASKDGISRMAVLVVVMTIIAILSIVLGAGCLRRALAGTGSSASTAAKAFATTSVDCKSAAASESTIADAEELEACDVSISPMAQRAVTVEIFSPSGRHASSHQSKLAERTSPPRNGDEGPSRSVLPAEWGSPLSRVAMTRV